jgi:antitoxin component HigA of HigAB toxin-antitoxin module
MKKLFLVLALAGVMAACGGEEKKAANDPKSLAKEVFEAESDEAYEAAMEKVEALSDEDYEVYLKEYSKLVNGESEAEAEEPKQCAQKADELKQCAQKADDPKSLAKETYNAIMSEDEDALNDLEKRYNKFSEKEQAEFEAELMNLLGPELG